MTYRASEVARINLGPSNGPARDHVAVARQLTEAFQTYLEHLAAAHRRDPNDGGTAQMRIGYEYFQTALQQLTMYSQSLIASALATQNNPTIRVEVDPAPDASELTFRVYGATEGASEVLIGLWSLTMRDPTATGGLDISMHFHLTPAGSRPLWDFGDVVAAEARETPDNTAAN